MRDHFCGERLIARAADDKHVIGPAGAKRLDQTRDKRVTVGTARQKRFGTSHAFRTPGRQNQRGDHGDIVRGRRV